MPIYDVECNEGHVTEEILGVEETGCFCRVCGAPAIRILSCGRSEGRVNNEDAPWIRSVAEIVPKKSDKPHCIEFLKNPTRATYKNFVKGEGLRHLEPGEKAENVADHKATKAQIKRDMLERWADRNRVCLTQS